MSTPTDPAVEAAHRAVSSRMVSTTCSRTAVDAAREALKPIREKCDELRAAAGELLHPTDPDYDIGNAFDDGVLSLIDELAPLIYTAKPAYTPSGLDEFHPDTTMNPGEDPA